MTSILLGRIVNCLQKLRKAKDVLFSRRYLLLTNISISASLSGVGDLVKQSYMIASEEKKEWDKTRTQHMTLTGISVGILCHNWYNFLDQRLPGRTIGVVFKKVLVDQLIFSPVMIVVFFVTLGLLKGTSHKTVQQEVWNKGLLLYAADWVVWPPAQVINFYLLPTKYRVLYDNVISLGYDIYTSHITNDYNDEL